MAWGLLNGLYQVAGDLTGALRQRLGERLHVRTDCGSHHRNHTFCLASAALKSTPRFFP